MIQSSFIFLGRTGVGKSSIINFLAKREACETNPYRACTKEPIRVSIQVRDNRIDLIDTPGLCEGDPILDEYYLSRIDEILLDIKVTPVIVFRADENRLRSEDNRVLQSLIMRYGPRLFLNGELYLTFAGNLSTEYDSIVRERVRQIAVTILELQQSLKQCLFPGFSDIRLLDTSEKRFYKLELPNNNISKRLLKISHSASNYEAISKIMGIPVSTLEPLIARIAEAGKRNHEAYLASWSQINSFPFLVSGKEQCLFYIGQSKEVVPFADWQPHTEIADDESPGWA